MYNKMGLSDRLADMVETRDNDMYDMTSLHEGKLARDVSLIEGYQGEINVLYGKNPIPREAIKSLKLKRDEILDKVLKFCGRFGSIVIGGTSIQRGLLRDRDIPIEWDTGKRLEGEENARADKDRAESFLNELEELN